MEFVEIIKIIWHDMITTPWGALLGIVIIILFLFKEQIREIISFIMKHKSASYGKSEYSKKDVLNHPIFRDLDYWINKGIKLVKIEKSYAKELIMKDVLYIKFNVIKDLLTNAIKNDTIDSMNNDDLKKFFQDLFRDIDAQQVIGWRNAGIPEVFIKKYLTVQRMGQEVVQNTIKVFLSSAINVTTYTKCYLILSVLDAQLTNVYANAVSTALSLNGDLNGTIYKGVIIGTSSTMYALDEPISEDLIISRLDELLSKVHCSRAGVVLFHAYPSDDPFDGKFSIVYEQCSPGVSVDKKDVQYMPAYLLNEFKVPFDNGEIVTGTIFDFDYGVGEIMREHGTEVLVAYPLKDDSTLKGFIKLNWLSKSKYQSDIKQVDLLKELQDSAEDIKKLLLGHKQ